MKRFINVIVKDKTGQLYSSFQWVATRHLKHREYEVIDNRTILLTDTVFNPITWQYNRLPEPWMA